MSIRFAVKARNAKTSLRLYSSAFFRRSSASVESMVITAGFDASRAYTEVSSAFPPTSNVAFALPAFTWRVFGLSRPCFFVGGAGFVGDEGLHPCGLHPSDEPLDRSRVGGRLQRLVIFQSPPSFAISGSSPALTSKLSTLSRSNLTMSCPEIERRPIERLLLEAPMRKTRFSPLRSRTDPRPSAICRR